LLLVFYLRDEFNGILDYIIKLVDEWNFPLDDLKIIKNDWQIIKNKIVSGNAHELSEGDTFYLGACTKGGKGGNLRNQPNNTILAKQRAYSLKQGYVNHIIASISKDQSETFGKLIKPEEISSKSTIEDIVISKFSQYYKKSITEILKELNIEINQKAKGFYSSLTKAILGIELDKEIEEFQKADVTIKTIRLKENSVPKESVSFPAFKYEELVKEEWEDSRFREILEHKFLFVFFQFEGKNLILKKVRFWNMSYTDIDKVKGVWVKTKKVIESGNIVREVVNDIRYTNFPSKKENEISHVRPHAQNSDDTYPLPVKDNLTNKMSYTKHCFWLNDTYVRDEIYLK
jgi:DNA mismatch repair protein MutH